MAKDRPPSPADFDHHVSGGVYRQEQYRQVLFKHLSVYTCSPNLPGNAKLQGLLTQLNLTGDQYNVALVGTHRSSFEKTLT